MSGKKLALGALAILHEICAMIGFVILIGFPLGWSHATWNGWNWPW